MVGHFATRLEVEAAKAGGSLTAAQIHALAQRFVATEQARFKGFYQRAWDQCTALREMRLVENARKTSFERILMRRFAHLFPARTGDDGGSGLLSRRIIPGFMLAVEKMIGPDQHRLCQERAEAIRERHAHPDGGWDWDAIHADPASRDLVNDILAGAAPHFAHFERRQTWFLDIINSHLAPAQPGTDDAHFRLSENGFAALMRALFTDLVAAMRADPTAAHARWGTEAMEAVERLFRALG